MIALAVFVTDLAISFFAWQRLDAWLVGNRWRCVGWNAALDLAIGVNTMGFVVAGWGMLLPSIAGSTLGTLASFHWRVF